MQAASRLRQYESITEDMDLDCATTTGVSSPSANVAEANNIISSEQTCVIQYKMNRNLRNVNDIWREYPDYQMSISKEFKART